MSQFLRLLNVANKSEALLAACNHLRVGEADPCRFEVVPSSFDSVPGKPFAYWVSESVRSAFVKLDPFETGNRAAQVGASTKDDFRFLRTTWEIIRHSNKDDKWSYFAKGGAYSKYFYDIHLLINWRANGREIEALVLQRYPYLKGNAEWVMHRESNYGSPGLTWPTRTQGGLGFRALPQDCVFSIKGSAAFVDDNNQEELLALLALLNSSSFCLLVSVQISFGSYEVGAIQRSPIPSIDVEKRALLAELAHRAWVLRRTLDSTTETSHAFALPAGLRARAGDYNSPVIEIGLKHIQSEIDTIAFALYGFAETDREALTVPLESDNIANVEDEDEDEDDNDEVEAQELSTDALLSWSVGVAFGRFDWRLATGERELPPDPGPFDLLPGKSPGILPDGAQPFHSHAGILVDDKGHPYDLVHLVEEVLGQVNMPVPSDVRRWLQKDFFAFHLQRYSKSRRKAPIYWPLSTTSGSYSLWVYYPSLNSETLYTAVNDFIEPKVKQLGDDVAALRNKGALRSRDDERQFEAIQAFESELVELRDKLLSIAQHYHPNHDDGVQISAAPLWSLFRHKPWQKVLKDTWAKLEKGDYDWAHLAMNYWPARVREKCHTDKSFAIAHGLEDLYIEPETKPRTKKNGKKNPGAAE